MCYWKIIFFFLLLGITAKGDYLVFPFYKLKFQVTKYVYHSAIQLIKKVDLLYSLRQPPNLQKISTRAKFSSIPKKKCCFLMRRFKLRYVSLSKDMSFYKYLFSLWLDFYVNENMSCKSQNRLYCIACNNSGEDYIGQTQLTPCMRIHCQEINDLIHCSWYFYRFAKGELWKSTILAYNFPHNSTNFIICIYDHFLQPVFVVAHLLMLF